MSNDTNPNATGHGSYERRDIGIGGVLYFIAILAVVCIVCGFIVDGLYHYLDKRTEAGQPPISPLLRNAPNDTRKLPAEYKTDSESADYQKYLESNFPAPQLETNERTELNKIRLREDQTLATYDWVDQNAGTVRIPNHKLPRQARVHVRPGTGLKRRTPPGYLGASSHRPECQTQNGRESKHESSL